MAEARSAVSYRITKSNLLFQISDEELVLRINKNFLPAAVSGLRRNFWYRLNRIQNSFFHAIYPAPPIQWGLIIATPAAIMLSDDNRLEPISSHLWQLNSYLPENSSLTKPMRVLLISSGVGTGLILAFSYLRRFLLRALLNYQGWIYDEPKKRNIKTEIWGFLVQLVNGNIFWKFSRRRPLLYSNQNSLPRLPVPSLQDTCERYLHSVRPLLNDEEYRNMEKLVEDFKRNEGKKLQFYLIGKSWITANYVTDWWEKYVYLRGRSSIAINSNYYILDNGAPKPATDKQVARAACIIYHTLVFKNTIDKENLAPMVIRGTVPMCMYQYERIFSTTRIPGKELDTLEHHDSTYCVVMRKGFYYIMELYNADGTWLSPSELEVQLKWIIQDADKETPIAAEAYIPALTAENRTTWANAREEFFSFGVNKISLRIIEKAMFVLSLEHREVGHDYTSMGKSIFHGNGDNRWFDKSFTMIVFPHAKAGLNVEHSWADAPVMAHVWEYAMIVSDREENYDENGWNLRKKRNRHYPPPQKLKWDLSQKAEKVIEAARVNIQKMIDDVDHLILFHELYGKGFIKKCGVSPDAYVQMAMQIAYRRDAGKFGLTYESSMTRLFKHGRTETVRPCTMASKKFVESFEDPSVDKKEKIRLLKEAAGIHQQSYRDSMSGKGIDRHLFALYVVSQGMEIQSKFLESALSMEWKLSTSQQPQVQTDAWDPVRNKKDAEKISPGGGFGPVSDSGYGVSYMMGGEDKLGFHISSKKSSSATDSTRFGNHIFQVLKEMKELFESQ